MLQPKRTKYRKTFKGKMKGVAQRGATLAFGSYGIKSLEEVWMTARQIEAARIAATRYMKREGQLWIRVFPDKPITKKPLEVRMGKGKGAVEYYAAVIRPGRMLFELDGVPEDIAIEALRLAAQKLPVKTKLVTRRDLERHENERNQQPVSGRADEPIDIRQEGVGRYAAQASYQPNGKPHGDPGNAQNRGTLVHGSH